MGGPAPLSTGRTRGSPPRTDFERVVNFPSTKPRTVSPWAVHVMLHTFGECIGSRKNMTTLKEELQESKNMFDGLIDSDGTYHELSNVPQLMFHLLITL